MDVHFLKTKEKPRNMRLFVLKVQLAKQDAAVSQCNTLLNGRFYP